MGERIGVGPECRIRRLHPIQPRVVVTNFCGGRRIIGHKPLPFRPRSTQGRRLARFQIPNRRLDLLQPLVRLSIVIFQLLMIRPQILMADMVLLPLAARLRFTPHRREHCHPANQKHHTEYSN